MDEDTITKDAPYDPVLGVDISIDFAHAIASGHCREHYYLVIATEGIKLNWNVLMKDSKCLEVYLQSFLDLMSLKVQRVSFNALLSFRSFDLLGVAPICLRCTSTLPCCRLHQHHERQDRGESVNHKRTRVLHAESQSHTKLPVALGCTALEQDPHMLDQIPLLQRVGSASGAQHLSERL